MYPIYTKSQIRELEVLARQHGISGDELMRRAGHAAFAVLRKHWPQAQRVMVICGGGHNGGDGYVLARILHEHGLNSEVRFVGALEKLTQAVLQAREACEKSGVVILPWQADEIWHVDLVVDAFLGIGLHESLRSEAQSVIHKMNASHLPIFSLDIPSGLHADSGAPMPIAIMAEATITFMGEKIGLLTNSGPDHTGKLFFNDLGLPAVLLHSIRPCAKSIQLNDYKHRFLPRVRNTHKGDYGHVLVIGGDIGMSGAPRLAALGAARVGAGLVSVVTHSEHAPYLNMRHPEMMCHGIQENQSLNNLFKQASVVALGPGLGQSSWSLAMLNQVIAYPLPMVIDADGLNLLSMYPEKRNNWILTPHPGEAARLLNISTQQIQQNRLQAVLDIQRKYGGVVILKGCGTLITDGHHTYVCTAGNPGMASGGMGDLLTGIIAGLLGQKLDLLTAACYGVALHAQAGDRVAHQYGERGMLASDLLYFLRKLVNGRAS